MEEQFQIDNFTLETELIDEQIQRKAIELSQFDIETQLIEKGVL